MTQKLEATVAQGNNSGLRMLAVLLLLLVVGTDDENYGGTLRPLLLAP